MLARVSGQSGFLFLPDAGENPAAIRGRPASAKGPLSRQRMEWTLQKVEQKGKEIGSPWGHPVSCWINPQQTYFLIT